MQSLINAHSALPPYRLHPWPSSLKILAVLRVNSDYYIPTGRAGLPSRVCGIMNLISSETTTTQGSGSRDSREGVLHPADDGQQARTAVQAHFFLWRSHTFCYHAQYSKLTKTGPMSSYMLSCMLVFSCHNFGTEGFIENS